ncbi:DNA-J related domain-containing protein [Marinobacterium lutimaris]|uniref:DnaJ domain-containing protein n=1 Tax=Marinobacterium lutimaris TaxID=568106 RepID=A0A1H6D9K7_9GAMM|nr:DNA-J related domain-containing protein [Marinobacterium lutimaris]SEG82197.1 DnaJ domain-containing protein [Marinobacterium lutimaris]
MQNNPLLAPIARLLHEHPQGLSEYALMKQLEFNGLALDQELDASPELLLFRKHFLIMNALYRLQPVLAGEGFDISISALHIQLHPLDSSQASAETAIIANDQPLRDYYLDWSEFEKSSSDYVRALLDGFWQRYMNSDRRSEAAQVLGLEEGASTEQIRIAYRRLASRHHPDRGGDADQFRRVREAYELLMV